MSRQLRNYSNDISIVHWANSMANLKNLLLPADLPHQEPNYNSPQPMLSISWSTNCTHTIKPRPSPMSINQSTCSTIPPMSFASASPPTKRQKLAVAPDVDFVESTISCVTDKTMSTPRADVKLPSGVNIDRIKKAVSNALEWQRKRRRLHWEHDVRVPIWAQQRAEVQLKLQEQSLDLYKHVVLETIHNYYEVHGKKPQKWIVTDDFS